MDILVWVEIVRYNKIVCCEPFMEIVLLAVMDLVHVVCLSILLVIKRTPKPKHEVDAWGNLWFHQSTRRWCPLWAKGGVESLGVNGIVFKGFVTKEEYRLMEKWYSGAESVFACWDIVNELDDIVAESEGYMEMIDFCKMAKIMKLLSVLR